MRLFGTDGIRGRANEFPLVPDFLATLGKAIGIFFKGKGVIMLGGDTRLSTPMISSALVSGISSTGRDVFVGDVIPTPVLAHIVKEHKAIGGVMVSASHNPWDDNGIKLFNKDGCKLSVADEEKFTKVLESIKPNSGGAGKVGSVFYLVGWQELYVEHLKSLFKLNLSHLKIVLDLSNGVACTLAPMVFKGFGANIIAINNCPNGININEKCGAGEPSMLSNEVLRQKADLGIAFDGDGDRLIMVDEKGSVVDGDAIMAILALHMNKTGKLKGGKIVATHYSNLALGRTLQNNGIGIEYVEPGDRFVCERMRESGFNLGGEKSGHIVLTDYETTGNGILTALAVLEAISGKKLSEVNPVVDFPQVMLNVEVKAKPKLETLPTVMSAIKDAENKLGQSGRIFVRCSGTQPLVRVMIEGESEKLIKILAEDIAMAIRKELC